MQIQCLTTFLDGRDRFEQGDVRTVSDEQAARFVAAGWASTLDGKAGAAATGATDLVIHNARQGTKDSNG